MTDIITWNPEMSVGVAILDEDHKRIMNMINKLHDAIIEGQGKQVMADILHDMFVYINLHFESEETLFDQTGYQGGDDQKKQHHEMRIKSLAMKQQFFDSPESITPTEILLFLKDWWIDHIMNKDMKYASFFKAHGIR